MKRPLKPALRDYFERQQLTPAQLERLQALAAAAPAPPATGRLRRWVPALVASLLVAGVALLLWVARPQPVLPPQQMAERIAAEVVRNHLKMKPLDVTTDNMDKLRRYFTELEFVPVESQLLDATDVKLLGGRYCSIQGVPAAQLRMAPADQGLQTLYQSEYRADIFGPLPHLERGETPLKVYHKGLQVRIWVEKGLLFALAGPAHTASPRSP